MTFVGLFQGIIALALERLRLLEHPVEPLTVFAPNSIKSWYDLVNSELIPLNSAIRYALTEAQLTTFC